MSEPDNPPTVEYAVFCGLDVGKAEHHAVRAQPGRQAAARPAAAQRRGRAAHRCSPTLAEHGPVLVVVDQPASIGALPIAVARSLGIEVAYLPGLAMRRIADLHPGEGKTDARDAYVIADAARTMPHTLRRVGTDDETLAELAVLAGYDDDLAAEATRLTNRLRDALLHIHPALERLLGPRLDRGGVLDLHRRRPHPASAARARPGRHRRGHATALAPAGQDAARADPRRARRPDRPRPRHHRVRPGHPRRRRPAARGPRRTRQPRGRARGPLGGPPSCRGPDLDARPRVQDRPEDPHHRRRRRRVPHRRAPRRLRRPRPGHPPLRHPRSRARPAPNAATTP